MVRIFRTQIGTFVGETSSGKGERDFFLSNPCLIEFITVPTQGKLGTPQIGIIRSIMAWPERELRLYLVEPFAVSTCEDTSSEFYKLYEKTVREAWPAKIIN